MKIKFTCLLFCLISVSFLPSCKSVKDPVLKGIEKVRIHKIGMKESSLSFDLLFLNPNNYRLKLKEASGEAWLDGNLLGHFTVDTLVRIPAQGDFRIPVQLKMDMNHFVENIAAAFMDKQVTIKVDGVAKAGKGILFINFPVRYEGKQKLSELLR